MSQGFTDQMRGGGFRVPREAPEPTFADLIKLAEEGGNLLSINERRNLVDRIRVALGFREINWDLVDAEAEEEAEAEVVDE